MGKLAIVLSVVLLLILLWVAMSPGSTVIRRILPGRGEPRQHVMNPPYMFHVVDANTQLNLP
jgi:hypothetical protein